MLLSKHAYEPLSHAYMLTAHQSLVLAMGLSKVWSVTWGTQLLLLGCKPHTNLLGNPTFRSKSILLLMWLTCSFFCQRAGERELAETVCVSRITWTTQFFFSLFCSGVSVAHAQ